MEFKFLDRVKVVGGFYEGQRGRLVDMKGEIYYAGELLRGRLATVSIMVFDGPATYNKEIEVSVDNLEKLEV